jgi:hypothetical protein
LGAARQIFGLRITRDGKNCKLTLSQGEYIEKVLETFKMQDAKPISTPLASRFKLNNKMCPKTHDQIDYMSKVPYSSTIDNFVYVIACRRMNIAPVVGVVSKYMNNIGKEHW